MNIDFTTQGTCSKRIEAEVENGIVKEVRFTGGCNGNLQGICALVKGMPVDEVIRKLEGIRCGSRPTSCPISFAGRCARFRHSCETRLNLYLPDSKAHEGLYIWQIVPYRLEETLVSTA